MRPRASLRIPGQQAGSTLIEVMVSVVVFSIGIIGLFRALALSMHNSGDVQSRAVASTIAEQAIGSMWVDRANLSAHVLTNANVPQLPGGTETITVNGNVVTVSISWKAPGSLNASTYTATATLASN